VLEPGPKAVFYRLQKTNARSKMLWLRAGLPWSWWRARKPTVGV